MAEKNVTTAILSIAERIFIEHAGKVRPQRAIQLAAQFVDEVDRFFEMVNASRAKEAAETVEPQKTVDLGVEVLENQGQE